MQASVTRYRFTHQQGKQFTLYSPKFHPIFTHLPLKIILICLDYAQLYIQVERTKYAQLRAITLRRATTNTTD